MILNGNNNASKLFIFLYIVEHFLQTRATLLDYLPCDREGYTNRYTGTLQVYTHMRHCYTVISSHAYISYAYFSFIVITDYQSHYKCYWGNFRLARMKI